VLPCQPGVQPGPDLVIGARMQLIYLVDPVGRQDDRYALGRVQVLEVVDDIAYDPLDAGVGSRMFVYVRALNEIPHQEPPFSSWTDGLSPTGRPMMHSRRSPAFAC